MPLFQEPYSSDNHGDVGIKYSTERHVACVFLVDTSGSMFGEPIDQLNAGIKKFKEEMLSKNDNETSACVDVAIISFGARVKVVQDFVPVSEMKTPTLEAHGGTPMGQAIDLALNLIEKRKAIYNEYGTPYFRPWIFCITDGEPNDNYSAAAKRLSDMESQKHVLAYCVGVTDFNREVMAEIFNRKRIFELTDTDFSSMFEFVSNSLSSIRNSDGSARPGTAAPTALPSNMFVMGADD